MNEVFQSHVDEIPILFEKLIKAPLLAISDHKDVPKKGIYVFYEDNIPIYVGRSNRMKARIKIHGNQSSKQNMASFAFLLARKEAINNGINVKKLRAELESDPKFADIFNKAKTRVSNMLVRVIEIEDQIVQTLFEVYASLALNTLEFNKFDTH